jgi:RNA recognition motif-containing protein
MQEREREREREREIAYCLVFRKDLPPNLTVFVGNLPFDVEEEELWDYFVQCGDILGRSPPSPLSLIVFSLSFPLSLPRFFLLFHSWTFILFSDLVPSPRFFSRCASDSR